MMTSPTSVDLIIDSIGQLCTMPRHDGGPQRGHRLGDLGLIENGAVAVRDGIIVAVGETVDIVRHFTAPHRITVPRQVVTPGFVDAHTHLVWAGDRAEEFEQRVQGATYQSIMSAGGGINRTVRQTRAASVLELIEATKDRLDRMLQHGTTTVEIKTGYGLDLDSELKMLNTIALLDVEHALSLVPTFMGAHAIPPEFADNPDGYVTLIVERMLPAVATWKQDYWPEALYCDVFCEEGAFTLEQTRRIIKAAKFVGLPVRIHADEFASLGATALAVEVQARSVDHLLVTTPEDVALLGRSDTIAVLLPATPFGLNIPNTAPAKALIAANAILALASDCNPGTAWGENMQMVLTLATRQLGLTPAQALVASTINAAFAVDLGDRVGSIEVGKQADLVIWDIPNYHHLGYRFGTNLVQTVIKGGVIKYQAREFAS